MLCVVVRVLSGTSVDAEDWIEFRGPGGQGRSAQQNLPVEWSSDSDNIAWRAPIKGLGWSSPVISKNRIWLTTAENEGKSLSVLCLDLKTGREVFSKELFRLDKEAKIHKKNSHASPSPILDGDRVYVHFGSQGTACLSTAGEVLWKKRQHYKQVHGSGASPVVFENLLILCCDGGDHQYVIGLDKLSGDEVWKTVRPESEYFKKFAFCTPTLIEFNGETQLVSPAANVVCGLNPRDGKLLWSLPYEEGYSVVPRPVYQDSMVYVCTGYDSPRLLAIELKASGAKTQASLKWEFGRGAPLNPSPLLVDGLLYVVNDGGIASCRDAKSGEEFWTARLGGKFSASPLYANERIYFLDEQGTTTVVAAGKTFRQIATNEVGGKTLASIVPVSGALLLRTDEFLYRIVE